MLDEVFVCPIWNHEVPGLDLHGAENFDQVSFFGEKGGDVFGDLVALLLIERLRICPSLCGIALVTGSVRCIAFKTAVAVCLRWNVLIGPGYQISALC